MLSPGFRAALGSVAASSPIPPKLNGSPKTGVQVSDPQASTHLNKNSERCCLQDRSEHHKFDRGLSKCEFLRSICSKTSICFLVQRRYASSSPRTTPRTAPESQQALTVGFLHRFPRGTSLEAAFGAASSSPEELKVQDTASGNVVHTVPEA